MREAPSGEYILRINLRSGTDRRRFCEVHVKGGNVYMFQPKKGGSPKVSYHQSGQVHLKVGTGPPLFSPRFLDPPERICTAEDCFRQSFENFGELLPYRDEAADEVFDIELPPSAKTGLTFAVVSIGHFFTPEHWEEEGVTLITLEQRQFSVPLSPSELAVCVRVLRLDQKSTSDCEQE